MALIAGLSSAIVPYHETANAVANAPDSVKNPTLGALHQLVVVDSGCTNHVFMNRDAFLPGTLRAFRGGPIKRIGGSSVMPQFASTVSVPAVVGDRVSLATFSDTYLCPEIGANLISVSQLDQMGVMTAIGHGIVTCQIGHNVLLQARRVTGLYIVQQPRIKPIAAALASFFYCIAPNNEL